MKTLGATIALRNGNKFDFCWRECIQSVLPICQEVVVAESQSEDDTRKDLDEWAAREPKIKVFDYPFTNPKGDGMWVMDWTNWARERLTTDYNIQMDADEILHEGAYDKIPDRIQGREVTLRCRRWNFWKDHKHLAPFNELCAQEVLRISPSKYWLPADVPVEKGRQAMNIDTAALDIEIFHYGFLRKPKAFFMKERALQEAFTGTHDPQIDIAETYDGNWMTMPGVCGPKGWENHLLDFFGSPHPKVAHAWLRERGYEP